jgi:hypothetical protein
MINIPPPVGRFRVSAMTSFLAPDFFRAASSVEMIQSESFSVASRAGVSGAPNGVRSTSNRM